MEFVGLCGGGGAFVRLSRAGARSTICACFFVAAACACAAPGPANPGGNRLGTQGLPACTSGRRVLKLPRCGFVQQLATNQVTHKLWILNFPPADEQHRLQIQQIQPGPAVHIGEMADIRSAAGRRGKPSPENSPMDAYQLVQNRFNRSLLNAVSSTTFFKVSFKSAASALVAAFRLVAFILPPHELISRSWKSIQPHQRRKAPGQLRWFKGAHQSVTRCYSSNTEDNTGLPGFSSKVKTVGPNSQPITMWGS